MAGIEESKPDLRAFEAIDTPAEERWLSRALKDETFGGALLLAAGVLALIVANSPAGNWYSEFLEIKIGFDAIGLKLSIAHWAADGLLAIFFLVAGLELKHELVHGSLSKVRQAMVPMVAAIAGMIFPALIYFLFLRGNSEALVGWAIPVATDIAFALAVLAVAGRGLPVELRAFLLTLAVVDDLGAITIIAVFYSEDIDRNMLFLTLVLLIIYALLQKFNLTKWYLLVPLGLLIWWATYQSGIHATVAGVAIALLTRVQHREGELQSPAETAEIKVRPISVAIAVPIFAFTAAGVDLRSLGFIDTVGSEIAIAVIFGLVVGKPLGVIGATYLLTRFTSARLNENLRWSDVLSVGLLAGIGFTVSLLITKLSFSNDIELLSDAKVGVLSGSLIAAIIAIFVMRVSAITRDKKHVP
ncbi:MAG: Na+/H+ antiporter NhaA [Actinobacteria bacterium]|nr:Na+/H+ antiporter NhaA [Actinomycetota bacterium]